MANTRVAIVPSTTSRTSLSWKASSLQWVEGWLGGMAATGQEGQIAGAISTPVIDLSNNDGECNVTVRAWGQEDDWLVIQGASPACYA